MKPKTYVITIKPMAAFGTPLKGDTIFGQFCWQLAEDPGLADTDLENLLSNYGQEPFVVFSSAWPVILEDGKWCFAFPRPQLPSSMMKDPEGVSSCADRLRKRKENKSKRWFMVPEDLNAELSWENLVDDDGLFTRIKESLSSSEQKTAVGFENAKAMLQADQQHNTINRLSGTTGKGMFAPYIMANTWYMPGMELALLVAVNEDRMSIEHVQEGLERIGEYGFGRDASTGLGRFSLGDVEEMEWPSLKNGQCLFTLAPCVPETDRFEEIFFQPFIRFGKHGAQLLHKGRPFKNPVVMADEGAVFIPSHEEPTELPWIGTAVNGVSKAMKGSVVQGYALALPFKPF